MVLKPDSTEITDRITEDLHKAISGFEIDVNSVETIAPEANGKIKTVKTEVSQ